MMKANLNTVNNQMALDYIMYMMTEGAFKESEIESRQRYNQMFLNYKSLQSKLAFRLEDTCAYFADEIFSKLFDEEILDSRVEAHFIPSKNDSTIICYSGIDWCIKIKSLFIAPGKCVAWVKHVKNGNTTVWSYSITNSTNRKNDGTPSVRVKLYKELLCESNIMPIRSGQQETSEKQENDVPQRTA